jgi:FdhD protein
VCGKSSLDALRVTGVEPLAADAVMFSRETLTAMPAALRARQRTFEQTGGLHAAAAFDSQGEILVVHEDVGRHNAVDKVIGTLLARDLLPASKLGLMVSGRASFELMQKTLVAGIPILAAVSAPSSLAVQLANEFNVSLVGFLRGDTFNIYSGGERIS